MADCRQLRHHMHALADGELAGGRAGSLHMHAAACLRCGEALAGARRVVVALERLGRQDVEPPADLPRRIIAALPEGRSGRWRRLAWTGGGTAALIAASMVAVRVFLGLGAGGASPLLPGARAGLAALAGWLQRFAAIFDTAQLLPSAPLSLATPSADMSLLAAAGLIVAGLTGAAAALALGAAQSSGARRRSLA